MQSRCYWQFLTERQKVNHGDSTIVYMVWRHFVETIAIANLPMPMYNCKIANANEDTDTIAILYNIANSKIANANEATDTHTHSK